VPADPRFEVVVAGAFAASPRALWAHARTMEGVNAELGPWVHMSVPRALAHRPLEEAPLGAEAFVSTMSLLGLVPFDRHHLVLTSVTPEHGFEERSWSWLQRAWWHDRTITPLHAAGDAGGTAHEAPRARHVRAPPRAPAREVRRAG
jgi:hypothetical protein